MKMPLLTVFLLTGCFMIGVAPANAKQAEVAPQAPAAPQISIEIDGDYGYGLPPNVSAHGHRIDTLINVIHLFSVIVLAGWTAFLVYCLVKFRQKPGQKASYKISLKPIHIYFVIGMAIFELILDIGLSTPVLATVKDNMPSDADRPLRVRVVAEQFAWNFHYAGPDGLFGKGAPEHINAATNPLGIDPNDPHGGDDIVSGELHVVVGRPVICKISSKDVIHSFSVPVLRVKQDAVPGMRIPVWFTAIKTGNYEVACAQLCGNNHYSMRALMVIHETEQEFADWIESQKVEEFDEDEYD